LIVSMSIAFQMDGPALFLHEKKKMGIKENDHRFHATDMDHQTRLRNRDFRPRPLHKKTQMMPNIMVIVLDLFCYACICLKILDDDWYRQHHVYCTWREGTRGCHESVHLT
jgi:hypothetical protein